MGAPRVSVCGGSWSWDQLLPWGAAGVVSPCFQELILPPVLLIAALFLAWFGLGKCQPGGNKAAGSRLSHNLYLVASGAVALGHAALTGTGLASLMACISGDEPCTPLSSLLASGQLCAAWLLAMVVTLRIPGRVPNDALRAWWLAAATVECLSAAYGLPWTSGWGAWGEGQTLALAISSSMSLVVALAGFFQRIEPMPEYDPLGETETPPPAEGWRSPQSGCSWASALCFGFMWPVLRAGMVKPLTNAALYCLVDPERAETNRNGVVSRWGSRVSVWLRRHPAALHAHSTPGETETTAEDAKAARRRSPSLARVLHDLNAPWFWNSAVLKVISLASFGQPIFLKRLVDFTLLPAEEVTLQGGIYLVAGLVITACVSSLASNHYNFRMSRLGIRLRGSLCMTLYEKAMRLHPEEMAARGAGQISSLLSIDINNLSWCMPTVHELWCIPVQLTVCLYLLYQQIGWSSLVGLVVMVLIAPPNTIIMRAIFRNQRAIMTARDYRIKLLTEIMGSIRAVKLMSWEGHLMDKIGIKRVEEISAIRSQAICFAFSGFMWLFTPAMVTVLSFVVFCLSGGILTAPKAFAALSLFSILRGPLSGLPRVVQLLAQASVALRRLESFLLAKEVAERPLDGGTLAEPCEDSQGSIPQLPVLHNLDLVRYFHSRNAGPLIDNGLPLAAIEGGTFRWQTISDPKQKLQGDSTKRGCLPCGRRKQQERTEAEQPLLEGQDQPQEEQGSGPAPPTLADINFEIKAGELVAVVGPVGAGKSSLLSALLNDISCESGTVRLAGRIAYCPQQPWIMNDTLRANILFGKEFEPEWYAEVVKACQLEPDMEMLPGGDLAEIGEKGLNLSGGQKARVSLARAVYCRPDVVLLDDVLSAVDVHVAAALLQFCILNPDLLGRAARVVVSHQLHWLGSATRVVMMESGKILAVGTAEELGARGVLNYTQPDQKEAVRKGGIFGRIRRGRAGKRPGSVAGSEASTSASTMTTTQTDVACVEDLEGMDEEPKKAPRPHNEQELVVAEDREEGAVAVGIWKLYIQQLGFGWVSVFTLLLVLSQVAQVLGDTTLALWTSSLSVNPEGRHFGPLILYSAASLASVTIMLFRSLALVAASIRASKRVHDAALWRVLRAPLTWLDTTPNGRIINRFQSDQQKLDLMLPATVGNVLAAGAAMAAAIIVVCVTAPAVALLLPPMAFLFVRFQSVYRASSREIIRLSSLSASKLYHAFGESLNGCSTIRAFGRQEEFVAMFVERIEALQRPFYLDRTIDKWLALRLDALGNSAVAIAALYGVVAHSLAIGGTSSTAVGLSLTYAFSLTSMLSMLLMSFAFAENALVSMERLHRYATLPSEPKLRSDPPEENRRLSLIGRRRSMGDQKIPTALERRMRRWSQLALQQNGTVTQAAGGTIAIQDPPGWPSHGALEFSDVSMRYRPGLSLVLRGLTFTVAAGRHVGIVGRTGAGKSSLLGVLFRLVEIESGSIKLDGHDIRSVGLHTLRSAMSIIPQEPVLFSGTLRFNLDPWDAHSDETLHTCLSRVGLMPLIEERGEGLAMAIGPNGENLSVGQRQLLCMARALLRKTRVVVLDEATASIDTASDAAIQRVLAEDLKGATVLTIAHRINTVMAYDEVMVMVGGSVAEMGPPADLARQKGTLFSSLYTAARAQGQSSSH